MKSNNPESHDNRIQAYLEGLLSDEECIAFEQEMQKDANLLAEVEAYKLSYNLIEAQKQMEILSFIEKMIDED